MPHRLAAASNQIAANPCGRSGFVLSATTAITCATRLILTSYAGVGYILVPAVRASQSGTVLQGETMGRRRRRKRLSNRMRGQVELVALLAFLLLVALLFVVGLAFLLGAVEHWLRG